jgi:hypothetical protein
MIETYNGMISEPVRLVLSWRRVWVAVMPFIIRWCCHSETARTGGGIEGSASSVNSLPPFTARRQTIG